MKPISLRRRFFLNSAILVIFIMVLRAILIDADFQSEQVKSEQEKLKLHTFNILAITNQANRLNNIPHALSNPNFNTPNSGLWAVVLDHNNQVIWQSLSIDALPHQFPSAPELGEWQHQRLTINEQDYFTTSYAVKWEQANDEQSQIFHFLVAKNTQDFESNLIQFRIWLIAGFILVTVFLLLIVQFYVLKFSFKPINLLDDEIKNLENGKQEKLLGNYPEELVPVTKNINMLIDKEYKQREKYRAAMADLAHSLKTPISIISAELSKYPQNSVLDDALSRMNTTIEYQLRRAVISGHNLLTKGTNILATLEMVLMALNKIYQHQNIQVDIQLDDNMQFMGDENDLLEIFGNLLDNGFKHARSKIIVTGQQTENTLTISVEDDGDGIPQEKTNDIFKRGIRLDETVQGQGIGLSIVDDIISSYEGDIELKQSELGGALFEIRFQLSANSD